MKINLKMTIFLFFLVISFLICYWLYRRNLEILEEERLKELYLKTWEEKKLKENLARFYEEYIVTPHPELPEGNISCDGVIIVNKSAVVENFSCISVPLYSSTGEAWFVVARGNFSFKNGYVNTGVDENVSENERIKKIYSFIISKGNEWCEVPCYDSSSPYSYEIKISYLPKEEELRRMFLEYNWNKISNLTLRSNALINLFYSPEKKESHSFSFGFRMGWQLPHKFSLTVKFVDGEIINYSIRSGEYENRKEECKNCQVTKIKNNEIRVDGISSYKEYPYLEVWWRSYER